MYSCCHLIAGRFSRVRYRSATESTESAAAATVARFSSSAPRAASSFGICSYSPPSSSFFHGTRARFPFPFRLARTRRAGRLFLYSALCRRATSNVHAASWWFSRGNETKGKKKTTRTLESRGETGRRENVKDVENNR